MGTVTAGPQSGPGFRGFIEERLTALRAEGCGRLTAAGCVEGLWWRLRHWTRLRREGSEGGGLPLRAMSFISRLRRSRQHRVSILSAYLVHPFPLRGTSPRWEACHWIRGSRGSPMNPVPLPPQGETRALRIHLSVSYGIIGILLIGSLRSPPPIRAAPDFPLFRGQNKTPRIILFISGALLSPCRRRYRHIYDGAEGAVPPQWNGTSYLPRAEPSTRPGGVSRSRTEPLAPRAKGPAAPSTLAAKPRQPSGIQSPPPSDSGQPIVGS